MNERAIPNWAQSWEGERGDHNFEKGAEWAEKEMDAIEIIDLNIGTGYTYDNHVKLLSSITSG